MTLARFIIPAALALSTAACATTATKPASAPASKTSSISQTDIEGAQRAWCDALIEIGRVGASGGDASAVASNVLSTAYDYDQGTVLFKPTLTHGAQTFRLDKAGALAYFVGGDPTYSNDKGFALKQWVSCVPKIVGVVARGDMAVAMGNVYLSDVKGQNVMVDKTFGYIRAADGSLRIVLHHSSLPFDPTK